MISDIAKTVFEKILSAFEDRRQTRLTVHKAFFVATGREYFFVNITNLSRNREIEITHIWFDCVPQIPVLNPNRMLPKRLKADETWETWIEVDKVPSQLHESTYTLARARLSTGKILKSIRNANVPESGTVPGGLIGSL
jgi:hypothetical protein